MNTIENLSIKWVWWAIMVIRKWIQDNIEDIFLANLKELKNSVPWKEPGQRSPLFGTIEEKDKWNTLKAFIRETSEEFDLDLIENGYSSFDVAPIWNLELIVPWFTIPVDIFLALSRKWVYPSIYADIKEWVTGAKRTNLVNFLKFSDNELRTGTLEVIYLALQNIIDKATNNKYNNLNHSPISSPIPVEIDKGEYVDTAKIREKINKALEIIFNLNYSDVVT